MKISDIITVDSIALSVKAKNKRQLLQELSQLATTATNVNERTIFDILLERENLGSTGFGGGVALPHGRLSELNKVHGFFIKLATTLDYNSIDGKPIDMLFLLLSPESSGADHLTALAQISRILKDNNMVSKLREATDKEEIYALLSNC